MAITGPDFIALQVRDLEAAARWYQQHLGLTRAAVSPPHAVVFDTTPTFALRDPLPGVDLDAIRPRPGVGVALWMGDDNAEALHDSLAAAGVSMVGEPFQGPFGYTFTFLDPDGYAVTVHQA
ncbi:VOC family protein [Nakamurella sp. A5-74]|uniref:VOC family protein n=1 Tax=Nakamurella sp. A5-74 TaxID=3158264 RepID=A0AAU8DSY9_9ACTN